jgi:Cu/Ag efflux protein CusF
MLFWKDGTWVSSMSDTTVGTRMEEESKSTPGLDSLWGDSNETQAQPPAAPEKRKLNTPVRIAVAGGLVVVLLGGGVAAAKGFSSHDKTSATATANVNGPDGMGNMTGARGNRAFGVITKIDGSTVTVTANGGMNGTNTSGSTTTIKTTDDTTFLVSTTGSLSDIKVGDNIQVAGTTSNNTIAATAITDQGTAGAQQPSGGSTQMGMQGAPDMDGNGQPPTDANMQPPTDGSGATPGAGGRGNGGTVTKVDGNTITITSISGSTMTVTTTNATTYSVMKSGSLSDLKVGQTITDTGTSDGNGVITATQVTEGARGAFGAGTQRRQTTTS